MVPRKSLPLLSLALLVAARAALAQPAFQVADVNPAREQPTNVFFLAEPSASLGGDLYFTADDGVHGVELWKTDGGSGAVLIRDLCPGACGGMPSTLTRLGSRLLFFADDGEHGRELWATDGTAAGTVLVADLWPGSGGGADTRWMLEAGGIVYFPANDGRHGHELWKSDGTAAGTTLVADIKPGAGSSLPVPKVTAGGLVLLSADDGTHGREPWRTDGTTAGTRLLKDVRPGVEGSTWTAPQIGSKDWLATSGGLFLFQAEDGIHGSELWASDGTETGTILLQDIWPGSMSGLPYELTELAGTVYFTAASDTLGAELWRTDGTPAGTSLVKDIRTGSGNSNPRQLTVSSGRLFFRAYADGVGMELWTTDGTEAGTTLVKDIRPGSDSSMIFHDPALTDVAGMLFLFADDGAHGLELWKSDGTEAGTVLVSDFSGQAVPTLIYVSADVGVAGGRLYFRAFDYDGEIDLWSSDGTGAGTAPAAEASSQTSSIWLLPWDGTVLDPSAWGEVGDDLIFLADSGESGNEPWASDGTAAGTRQLASSVPGMGWSFFHDLTPLPGGGALFSAGSLWKTDGTPPGTDLLFLSGGPASVRELTRVGATVFFSGSVAETGEELWKTDGTAAGTTLVADSQPGPAGASPYRLTAVGTTLFFVQGGAGGLNQELWKSDGTAPGTVRVKDIHPGGEASVPDRLTNVAGLLFFSAEDGTQGRELWKSDGTAAGTVLVKDIAPGPADSMNEPLTTDGVTAVLGSTLFFVADDGMSGPELWASDGTGAGTRRVRDIRPGAAGSEPLSLTAAGGRLYFSADDGAHGRELWVSDGSEAGTRLVEDILPGAGSSLPRELAAAGNFLVFSAFDEAHGVEPWVSDGSAEGTRRLDDIAPGSLPSSPTRFTPAGENVYFAANDTVTGFEVWAIPQEALGSGLDFYTVAPCRVIDTRPSSPLVSHTVRTFTLAGHCGIPPEAGAVAVNLTVIGATASGEVAVWPAGTPMPETGNVFFPAGVNRAASSILKMSGGQVDAVARTALTGEVHLILDVVGYFRE